MYNRQNNFNVRALILKAEYKKINGINKKVFTAGDEIFISAKSYGGTEKIVNDKYVIEDTMICECWYRPDITSDCNIILLDDNSEWEIINSPENIERKNKYLKFKIKKIKGGA